MDIRQRVILFFVTQRNLFVKLQDKPLKYFPYSVIGVIVINTDAIEDERLNSNQFVNANVSN